MGVKGLTFKIESYAEQVTVKQQTAAEDAQHGSRNAIIDGPALAWHILSVCRAQRQESFPVQRMQALPGYRTLTNATIAWLDTLCKHGFQIRAILFDGYLPKSKRGERMRRMQESVTALCGLRSRRANEELKLIRSDDMTSFDVTVGAIDQASRVVPPLEFVHSIFYALRQSERFGPYTRMVPGEADIFCAELAQTSSAHVLTGDSDLLVHNIGPESRVIFLRDMDFSLHGCQMYLSYREYHPAGIAAKLKVPDLKGMAWYLTQDPHRTVAQAAALASQQPPSGREYTTFAGQYSLPEATPLIKSLRELGHDNLTWLFEDFSSRFLEMVLQIPIHTTPPGQIVAQTPVNTTHPNSQDVVRPYVYLPAVMENPATASAYDPGVGMRDQMYSLLQYLNPNVSTVFEHARCGATISTVSMGHLKDKTHDQLQALAEWFEYYVEELEACPAAARWRGIAIKAVNGVKEQHRQAAPSRDWVTACVIQHAEPPLTWELLHFKAEWQTMLFSFDMLRQLCRFIQRLQPILRMDKEHASAIERMSDALASLAGLAELFDWRSPNAQPIMTPWRWKELWEALSQ